MKLVRDKIPAIMQADGEHCTVMQIATDDVLYNKLLMQKLVEEVMEFTAVGNTEELADVLEVLDAIIALPRFLEVRSRQAEKASRCGAFKKGFLLTT